ncbi:MAG: N-acyl homoserine lactonase family protein [Anaerolineae bacterium]
MKLYMFECGILKSQKHLFTMGRGVGVPFDVPVPFFLIEHKDAKVLYDTGNALEVARDKIKHWGAGTVAAYDPIMTEDQYVVNQLAKLGITPQQITHVVFSHLHLDHAGGTGAFPNATYYVQRAEMQYAYVPDFYQRAAYIRADFDKPYLNWYLLEGHLEDFYDLLGDGKIKIVFTPGHTPGHQSLLVDLDNWGPTLLTGDSIYTTEILNEDVLPGLVYSPPDCVKSIKKMRNLQRVHGVRIITGHDPDSWATLKKAPEYYD